MPVPSRELQFIERLREFVEQLEAMADQVAGRERGEREVEMRPKLHLGWPDDGKTTN
jgi:hypothetical protein